MVWESLLQVPVLVVLAAIIAATITDIRSHEVPDWLSYSLIAAGIIMAALDTALTHRWTLAYSLVGLAVGYGLGALLYYTGQWGGGDAKLLMGIGASLTMPWSWLGHAPSVLPQVLLEPRALFASSTYVGVPLFAKFLLLLVLCGCVYGLFWMGVLIVRNRARFHTLLRASLEQRRLYRWGVLAISGLLVAGALVLRGVPGLLLVTLAALIYGTFYLMLSVKIAETEFMRKTITTAQLTEGDWVVGGVKVGKTWIIPENNIGATKEQIAVLQKRAPRMRIIIKEGIPFVPSFLAAIVIALL